ncbi:DUF4893 domain-containing protein [Labrys sp. La1]|uniref:DUF4893 domain-containing protein n=1 Tax=Labrys sp. La1 TaxID=3404917 RepID=UPI003EB90F34
MTRCHWAVVALAWFAASTGTALAASEFDPTPLLPVSIEEADRSRLMNFEQTRRSAIDAVLGSNARHTADGIALEEILAGDPRPIANTRELVGNWRCRSAQLDDGSKANDGKGSIYAYPYFKCAISERGGKLFFAKVNGSQRVSGFLYRVSNTRFVFLGGNANGDDPPVAYGASPKSDAVAYLFKAGPRKLRLELPQTCCSTLEILELVR